MKIATTTPRDLANAMRDTAYLRATASGAVAAPVIPCRRSQTIDDATEEPVDFAQYNLTGYATGTLGPEQSTIIGNPYDGLTVHFTLYGPGLITQDENRRWRANFGEGYFLSEPRDTPIGDYGPQLGIPPMETFLVQ